MSFFHLTFVLQVGHRKLFSTSREDKTPPGITEMLIAIRATVHNDLPVSRETPAFTSAVIPDPAGLEDQHHENTNWRFVDNFV